MATEWSWLKGHLLMCLVAWPLCWLRPALSGPDPVDKHWVTSRLLLFIISCLGFLNMSTAVFGEISKDTQTTTHADTQITKHTLFVLLFVWPCVLSTPVILSACVGESVFLCLLMRRDRICPVFSVRAMCYNAAEEPQQGVLGNEVVDMAMIRPSLS